ncbi:MAG: LysR substrate-binding domain-containing protein [Stappiaceae bacterium]
MHEPYDLPPLTALRAFEAAARHASFTKAAEELGMTQAAVSYQIKVLEDRVGKPLFHRKPRQVFVTDIGQILAPQISEALEKISQAYVQAKGIVGSTLTIKTNATFAMQWLAPRLGSFQIEHPEFAVRVIMSEVEADPSNLACDIAIQCAHKKPDGLAGHELLPFDFTPMLHPKLADTIGGVREPADLLRLPIVENSDPWWQEWFKAAGITSPDFGDVSGTRFGTQSLEVKAALAGQGVAILTPAFYREEMEQGRLIQPFDLVCRAEISLWLVYPENRRSQPTIRRFLEWLLPQFQNS